MDLQLLDSAAGTADSLIPQVFSVVPILEAIHSGREKFGVF